MYTSERATAWHFSCFDYVTQAAAILELKAVFKRAKIGLAFSALEICKRETFPLVKMTACLTNNMNGTWYPITFYAYFTENGNFFSHYFWGRLPVLCWLVGAPAVCMSSMSFGEERNVGSEMCFTCLTWLYGQRFRFLHFKHLLDVNYEFSSAALIFYTGINAGQIE